MTPPDALSLRGFLADGDSGAGLGGLRVELWSAGGGGRAPLAVSRSDDSGLFAFRISRRTLDGRANGQNAAVEVELRVKDEGKLLHSERVVLDGGCERLELQVPPQHGEAVEGVDEQMGPSEVRGHVKGPLTEGTKVEAILTTLSGGALTEQTVAESAVNASGWFRMQYGRPANGGQPSDTSLTVRLRSPEGELIVESAPILSPPREARVDLRLPADVRGSSEYALLEECAGSELEAGVGTLDELDASAVEEVAEWLDVEPERLLLLQEARRLEARTGLPASLFYALGRSGVSMELAELTHVPVSELRTTIEEAVANQVVDTALLDELDAHVERIAAEAIDATLGADRDPPQPGLAEILAAADLPSETIRDVLGRYQAREGEESEFWEDFTSGDGTAEAVDGAIASEVESAVSLAGLVGVDPPLLRRLHELRREGEWRSLEELAEWGFDDWCELLEEVEPPPGEAAEDEESADERVEDRAEAIMDALEEAFPSEIIRHELIESEEVSPGARRVLERAGRHDFLTSSIRERAAADPMLLEDLEPAEAEAALEEIEAVERISRVTPRAEEVAVLVATGMRSALEIASMAPRHFIEAYGEALGGRPQAARVHAQAQQAAAATRLATIRLLQAYQQTPFVLGGGALKDIPDARTLFGSIGMCECKECGSVYSPAAYFVDLLRYLNIRDPKRLEELREKLARRGFKPGAIARLGRYRPLDVLLARRPDLADLPLTCENTLTPLPYIDLVNELLEARVAGGSAAFDTGSTPADVLRAVPQNVNREAYRRLQEAVHPIALPYHEPLAVARAYLGHLGVTRLELMRALGKGPVDREALVAEALGMSRDELRLVALSPPEPWRHLGFDAERSGDTSYLDAVARVPAFLEAAGITFQNLIDLASSRFVNPNGALVLESPVPDCDPDKIKLVGLDEARLSRLVRLLRLQRRLGWSFTDLDRALHALGARDLDLAVLEKLAEAKDLARALDRPIEELLVLWAPLDTFGKDNEFDRLLSTRAVAWRTEDVRTFQLRPDRAELAQTGESLDPVAAALLAAFRITSEELARIRSIHERRGSPPRLDLAGLSAIQRVAVLARALRLRVDQLDALLRLVPPEADPFRPAEPSATRRFVEIVREVQATDFTPEKLLYLFRHEVERRRDPSPLPTRVQAVRTGIRRALVDAAETTRPAEPSGDTLRQKLGMLLDPALLGPAMDVLDPRTPATAAERRRFFDRHLARIFPDPAAAAARLFGEGGSSPAEPLAAAASPQAPAGEPAPPSTPVAEASPAASAPVPREPPPFPGSALERRWQGNIELVLQHLLPLLRVRLTRGAVVQALSDDLGTSAAATARLLESVLKSRRRAGERLMQDFLALLGTGLTGAYFRSTDLAGEPAVVRIDPELSFSWAGAAAAEGVPERGFGVRWTGHLLPRSQARHAFYVRTDGAVRLVVKVAGTERVLIDQPATSGRVVEHASEPVALDEGFTEIRLEYRNQGAPAHLVLEYGTAPGTKQAVPTVDLFPVDGLSSYAPVEASYRRLHKAALLLTGFGISDAQLEWLTGDPPYLDLDALPVEAGSATDAVALFRRWRQLAGLVALRKKLPRSNAELFDVFRAGTLAEAIDRLVAATGWDRATVEALVGPRGLALDAASGLRPQVAVTGDEPAILRLARTIDVQRRLGVAPATLFAWAAAPPDADVAAAIVQAVKARYDEKRWLEVARSLNDPLRSERRDALVAYLLPRMRAQGVKNRSQLFEYFLIDVEMSPCMLTSRIRQAISAVQTFFQRCLMNLEPNVHPRLIDDRDWKWLKSYRVWEANRKIFLYPENWIEPELRDDKSPLFQELERTILQQEIKKENVESAFADYLEGLDEIGRLDVRGVWFERRAAAPVLHLLRQRPARVPEMPRSQWDEGTYHVFARTFNAPHDWYYRRLKNGRTWTAWEKVDADIEGDHLVPVLFQRRMYLFWTVFREANKPTPPPRREDKGRPPQVGKDWEIHLAYSVYDRGRWSRKRMSSAGAKDVQRFLSVQKDGTQLTGSAVLSPADYTLRATATESRLQLHLYRRGVDRLRTGIQGATSVSTKDAEVERVARFELDGSNGELVLAAVSNTGQVVVVGKPPRAKRRTHFMGRVGNRKRSRRRAGTAMRPVPSPARAFQISSGGLLPAPSGYRVSGTGFSPSHGAGRLLALPSPRGGGTRLALGAPRGAGRGARIVPVVDPAVPSRGGLFPFFYQDRVRSYFARPAFTGWKPPRLVALPLIGRRAPQLAPRFGRKLRPRPARRLRSALGRRREELEAVAEAAPEGVAGAAPEALDVWEDELDEAWHPEDADEARRRRRTRRRAGRRRFVTPARPGVARRAVSVIAPRPAPVRLVRLAGYHEQRLRFTAFEHPTTGELIRILKTRGVDGLLALVTTRPRRGRDHVLDAAGKWIRRRPSWFERRYAPGPLVDLRQPPHLDVDFDWDSPYALYNWELFFHAPLQVAVRLAKDGRHEEAQRWFHFIFDPTTDVSAPAPQRYWRFAPFHENTEYSGAREMMALLSYAGDNQELLRRQRLIRDQVTAWWEKPFSPHVIARLRTAAYQKAVVMKYIDNLIEWGDKLFRRDTMETIQEATQLYILAGNILGRRPERIPPLVDVKPVTFAQVRDRLDVFANWEVRFENSQVRRPFRISAQPDAGAATSILGMATQYFCTPANPQMDKYWDTVADRLFKIRNCMNIQGVVRQLPLFEPPIDPGLLVRAAAAGVDLGSVIASLNAPPPHHRFRLLVARAVRLAEELRSFGAMTLQVLERKDAEGLTALRASSEAILRETIREIRRKQVKQVEEEIAELSLQREYVELQAQYVTTQLQSLMNPQEDARQQSLTAGQVIADVAEGADLISKVLYAIPDFQTGGAGAFSSPFATVQLGGQMFGDISAAFAESLQNVMARHETEADMAAIQAEYQRRRQEWQQELELLAKDKAQIEKRITETQLKLEIASAELRRRDVEVENARKVEAYLREKYTNEQLYGWMLGQLSGVYFQAYKFAFDAAQQAERAFRFERGEPSASFVQFSYWDSLKKGLFAGERLLLDLRRMEGAYVEGDRRALEVTRHLSLREDYPAALQELLATGRCQIDVTEALLDGDFPGHYFRRVKSASLTIRGALRPLSNVNCTLTLLENRIRKDANASGTYAQSEDGDDSRLLVNPAPVHAVATSRPQGDAGVFELKFDDDRYLPFEGAGAISTWRIELRQAENAVDLSELADVVLTLAYTARHGGAALEAAARASREKALSRGGLKPATQHLVSLRRDLPVLWKRLGEAEPGKEIEAPLPLEPARLPGRLRGLDVGVERVIAFAHPRGSPPANALRLRLDPPKGSGALVTAWAAPWSGARALRGTAELSGAPGAWKVALGATGAKVPDLFEDVALVFVLRARKT